MMPIDEGSGHGVGGLDTRESIGLRPYAKMPAATSDMIPPTAYTALGPNS